MASERFERSSTVQADPAKCWEVVTDVPRLVEWVSVLEDAREVAPLASYTAVLADRLGPFKLTAELDITVSEVVPGEHIRVQAAGEDHQVKSRIGIDAVLTLAPATGRRHGGHGDRQLRGHRQGGHHGRGHDPPEGHQDPRPVLRAPRPTSCGGS